jgi:hypothetical protein
VKVKVAKKFNVTGTCIPEKHYMVDISGKIKEITAMVEEGFYFTINRPRQFGKTTAMFMLAKYLAAKYTVIDTSFEGVGDNMFETETKFCREIVALFARSVKFVDKILYHRLKSLVEKTKNYNDLSENITQLMEQSEQKIVLIIDEIDKSSGNRVFMQFLGMLRNKYLKMNEGKDITFQSVILGGVHDIKNLKIKIRDEQDKTFNSPWNVAADFKVDMSFSTGEIRSMLVEYVKETGIQFDTLLLAEQIRNLTNGYPYLVSRLCKNIDENLERQWTQAGLEESMKMILNEKSTLFDDIIKNMENNPELKAVIYEILVEGKKVSYNPDAYEKGIIYGIFSQEAGKLIINNKIFEERIYNYMIEQQNIRRMATRFTNVDETHLMDDGILNMEKVLLKFQEFMHEEYRQEDERFYETNGRLIFLAYLKPIINGRGFSFVEAQTRENKRMDVVITFGQHKFVTELKLWNGQKYEEKGIEQLVKYLDIQKLNQGYLIVFNFNINKQYKAEWIEINGKRIFEVIV